jgi:hypothetical protein
MLSMGIESGPDLTIFWCRKYESFVTIPAILWCAPCPNFKDKASNCTPLWLGELHYVLVLRPRQQAQEHRHYGWAAFYAPLFASVWFSSSYAFLPCDCLEVIGTFQCLINDIHFRGGPLFYSRGGPSKLVFLRCSLPFGLSFLRLALLGHVIAPAFIQPRQSTANRQARPVRCGEMEVSVVKFMAPILSKRGYADGGEGVIPSPRCSSQCVLSYLDGWV